MNNDQSQEKTLFEKLVEDLSKIREALERLERSGINQTLMVLYIHDKTKLGKQKIQAVLEAQREFLREALKGADQHGTGNH